MVREYRPAGYGASEPLIPHGQSVAVTAPAAFRFTFAAAPDRHQRAAALLGGVDPSEAGTRMQPELLPEVLVRLMRDSGVPSGVAAFGYREANIPEPVAGAMQQQTVAAASPGASRSASPSTSCVPAAVTRWS
jgi:alcohol dehydrogenase class IV